MVGITRSRVIVFNEFMDEWHRINTVNIDVEKHNGETHWENYLQPAFVSTSNC